MWTMLVGGADFRAVEADELGDGNALWMDTRLEDGGTYVV